MLGSFVRLNRRLSYSLTPSHYSQSNVFENFIRCGGLLLALPDVSRVLDVGAGKAWHFPPEYKPAFNIHLIGVDIDMSEMTDNHLLDEKHEVDATKSLAVPAGTVDLITVFSGIEHFSDNQTFLKLAYAALRPGGRLIAQFPGSWAPFALMNRLVPQGLKERILQALVPGSAGVIGFKAYYNRTRYSRFKAAAKNAGFNTEFHIPGYFSSGYFAFFFPLYVLSLLFDLLRYALGWKDFSSYNMFVLQKPGPSMVVAWK